MFKTFILVTALILFVVKAYPQEYPSSKWEISGGFGWPEMASVKIKYGNDLQVGISQGFMLNSSLEIYYHFAGKLQYSDHPAWYGMGGIEYFYWAGEKKNVFPYLRIGRTFNFSRIHGINTDLGLFYLLYESDYFSKSSISLSGSITFLLRL